MVVRAIGRFLAANIGDEGAQALDIAWAVLDGNGLSAFNMAIPIFVQAQPQGGWLEWLENGARLKIADLFTFAFRD